MVLTPDANAFDPSYGRIRRVADRRGVPGRAKTVSVLKHDPASRAVGGREKPEAMPGRYSTTGRSLNSFARGEPSDGACVASRSLT
jgi:hypothetical protein